MDWFTGSDLYFDFRLKEQLKIFYLRGAVIVHRG